ncbi:hypothetical protein [uncultured Draconibacterium sp.]|uniref:hypothetical protein n=1 Tax=uncultured Draconibacterium sp. TaxID=1573823 RepID=UPI0025E95350|nr:hypothetical protein [uncultured Draconibacterium sp.]
MRIIITIFVLLTGMQLFAQQGLQMDFGEVDSSEIALQRQLEYYNLVNGSLNNNALLQELQLPDFNINNVYQSRYTLALSSFPQFNTTDLSLHGSNIVSPLFYNAEMLSSAAYQLGDKFVFGGYSYGANHVLSAPTPNPNSSYFDAYGSTMFLQYKVSKKFKIETSISIQQNRQGPAGILP